MTLSEAADTIQGYPLDEIGVQLPGIVRPQPRVLLTLAKRIGGHGAMFPNEITDACAKQIDCLHTLAPDELIADFTEVLLQPHVEVALEWLLAIGFIKEFYPELEATKHLQQEPGRHHKDVWEHTKLVVKQSVRRPAVRWGALLHDIGKVPTRRFTANGVTFHGHAEVGARMFDKIAKRMPFEPELQAKIRFLINYHLRSAQYEESWSDSAVRRFYRDMDENLVDLLDLSRADITSKRPGRRRQLLFQISGLADRINNLRTEDEKGPNLPKGLGLAIMEHFSIPPSKALGNLIKTLDGLVDSGELQSQQEFGYYLDWLSKSQLIGNGTAEELS